MAKTLYFVCIDSIVTLNALKFMHFLDLTVMFFVFNFNKNLVASSF